MKPNNLYPTPLIRGIIADDNPVEHTLTVEAKLPEHKAFSYEMHITNALGYDPIREERPEEETEIDLIRHLGKMEIRCWENSYQSENFEVSEIAGALLSTERNYRRDIVEKNEEIFHTTGVLALCLDSYIGVQESISENRSKARDSPHIKKLFYMHDINNTSQYPSKEEKSKESLRKYRERRLESQKEQLQYQHFRQISGSVMATGMTAGSIILSAKSAYEFASIAGVLAIGFVSDMILANRKQKDLEETIREEENEIN